MAHVQELTGATFDSTLASAQKPVLVDFFATWCPPCKALAPVLEELAAEFGDRLAFYKVNVDQEPRLAARQQVSSVPTLALFAGGEQVFEIPGFVGGAKLRAFVQSVVAATRTLGGAA